MSKIKLYEDNLIENEFGYCHYIFEDEWNSEENKAEIYAIIYDLYIYEEFRRKGKAREILETIIKLIRETDYDDEIFISAEPREDSISENDLKNFYDSLGLTIIWD